MSAAQHFILLLSRQGNRRLARRSGALCVLFGQLALRLLIRHVGVVDLPVRAGACTAATPALYSVLQRYLKLLGNRTLAETTC